MATGERCVVTELKTAQIALESSVYQSWGEPPGEYGIPTKSLETTVQPEPDQRRRPEAALPTGRGGGMRVWTAQGRLGLSQVLTEWNKKLKMEFGLLCSAKNMAKLAVQ